MVSSVLVIGGSDSSGCAGLQADLRAVAAYGLHGATALTAATAQNSLGISHIFPLPEESVAAQMEAVLADLEVGACKSGMLAGPGAIRAIARVLKDHALPYVLDPVMTATTGGTLLGRDALALAQRSLFPLAALVTPNAREAEALCGLPVSSPAEAEAAGQAILASGCGAVLVKGGHLPGREVTDVLVSHDGARRLSLPRIDNRNTRGTGCTLATAIACELALGHGLLEAVERARSFTSRAIVRGYQVGQGPGPVAPLPRGPEGDG